MKQRQEKRQMDELQRVRNQPREDLDCDDLKVSHFTQPHPGDMSLTLG